MLRGDCEQLVMMISNKGYFLFFFLLGKFVNWLVRLERKVADAVAVSKGRRGRDIFFH